MKLSLAESREKFGRPHSKYAESAYGGDTYYDDVCLLINGLAVRCTCCSAPTRKAHLRDGICPDCRGLPADKNVPAATSFQRKPVIL